MIFITLLLVCLSLHSQTVVSGLKAECRGGKTYITFNQIADTTAVYRLYRSTSKIASVDGSEPLVEISHGSAYDKRFKRYHVIVDSGMPLDSTKGLFVYTPKVNGDFYYAVTSLIAEAENRQLIEGENSLSTPVTEEYRKWPLAVLRDVEVIWGNPHYHYFFWQDYFDWNHDLDYYGNYFDVGLRSGTKITDTLPLNIYLHGCCTDAYGVPKATVVSKVITIALHDHQNGYWFPRNTYWYGVAKNFKKPSNNNNVTFVPKAGDTIIDYTHMQIMNALHSVLNDNRFRVDTNRIYVSGQSMGGFGTKMTAFHNPDVFAACFPQIGHNFPTYPRWREIYGLWADSVTARNGVKIYYETNLAYLSETHPEVNYPPMINGHGLIDGHNTMWTHSIVIKTFAKNKHGIWDKWHPGGHSGANITEVEMYRFKKNELYPVFTNASTDDNYGKDLLDNVTPYNCIMEDVMNADTFNAAVDSAGMVNLQLDWTSSLHDADPSNNGDSLIDSAEMLAISFIAKRPNTFVDITPRRIQRFPVIRGYSYKWKNIEAYTNTVIDSGEIMADEYNLLTVSRFRVTESGNRLIITQNGWVPTEKMAAEISASKTISLSTTPNPFNPTLQINIISREKITTHKLMVYDLGGKLIENLSGKTVATAEQKISAVWDATAFSSGIFVLKAVINGKTLTRRVMLVK